MKTLIVYETSTGNTKKVAEAMASVLNAKLVKTSEVKHSELSKYDLIGFGSGIYYGKHHKKLLNFVEAADSISSDVFIFSTAGMVSLKFLWHSKLKKLLKKKNAEIKYEFILPGESNHGLLTYFGGFRKGHPNKADLEKARKFASKLIK